MNFLHLKYLIEVEKYESISKAAQHLYINQPRLSKIIKEIEEEANIKIFERPPSHPLKKMICIQQQPQKILIN